MVLQVQTFDDPELPFAVTHRSGLKFSPLIILCGGPSSGGGR
jgi:hypothetical protein